jgi:restriction endonuclease, S subunit
MKTLPNGWAKTNLSKVSTINYGKSIQKHERNSTGKYPIIGSSGIIGHHNKFLVTSPCIVIGRKGAAGSTFLVKEDCWPIDTTFYLVSNSGINSTFLNFLLKHKNLGQLDKSTTIPSLSRDDLYQTHIDLPPEREQVRISEKLEELLSHLDAGMAELQAAQKKLTQYRQSLLKAAVEGQLTADWRKKNVPTEDGAQLLERILSERRARWEAKQLAKFNSQGKKPPKGWQSKYPEPARPDTENLPELPEGWVWATIEEVGNIQLGRQRSPSKLKGLSPTKYIRAANITENGVDLSDVLHMDFNEEERETFYLQQGDILLTEASGSPEHVGRPAIWKGPERMYCFQNTVLRFSPKGITSTFSYFSFMSMQKLGIFRKLSSGVGINHLSAGKFSRLPIAIPGAQEQEAIVSLLDQELEYCNKLEREIDVSLSKITLQRQNILRAAFAGELVPQDPNDEPASELLARIAAERAAKQVSKRAPTERNNATGIESFGTKRRKRKEAS